MDARSLKCESTFSGTIPQVVARLLGPQSMTQQPDSGPLLKSRETLPNLSLHTSAQFSSSTPGTSEPASSEPASSLKDSIRRGDLTDSADEEDVPSFIPVGTMVIPSSSSSSCSGPPSTKPSETTAASLEHRSPTVQHPATENSSRGQKIHPQASTGHHSRYQQASFPSVSPSRKGTHLATATKESRGRGKIRKQLLKKSHLRQDPGDDDFTHAAQKRDHQGRGKPRRMKTGLHGTHHPLIHHTKLGTSLPQASLEEEVVDTPLDQGKGDHRHSDGRGKKDLNASRLRFEITSDDGFSCQGDTMEDAWNQVIERVQDVRAASRMKQLSYAGISGRSMFSVDHHAVVYLIEQLYGAVHCHRQYKFRFHKYDLEQADEEVALNPSGAARCEHFKMRKPFDMFNFLKSVYRIKPDSAQDKEEEMALKSSRRATSLSLPMAMRFRKLKTFAKEAVDVFRSKIHGRGLFCKRNIDAGEMVIEYAGEVIRASLTDKREKYYEGKGIGCYMFRIDDDEVVDATMHGSAARFINHSCEPNCFSKVILVDGKKHIVIFAMRPIKRGEELTYDYKFPIEEVKIPCSCGSKRCRRYLN